MCGAYTLQSTWDGKHQSKHMNLRHVDIVSHRVTPEALHYCTLFKRKDGRSPNEMPILWVMVGFFPFFFFFVCVFCFLFFFPKKNNWKKPFQQHAKWFSPFDMIILWSEWALRARNRAACYKIHWKRDVRCGFLSWLSAWGWERGKQNAARYGFSFIYQSVPKRPPYCNGSIKG